MNTPILSRCPPLHPLFDEIDVAGRGCQIVVIIRKAGDSSIVQDRAAVVAHHTITSPPDSQLGKPMCVDFVEECWGILASHNQLAECAYINQTSMVADSVVFLRYRSVGKRPFPHS